MKLRSVQVHITMIAILTALAVPAVAGATDFFVSSTVGNDNWSGRLAEPNAARSDGPFQTLVKAKDVLNGALAPGDRISLRRGDTWSGMLGPLSGVAGTATDPITIGAYGSGSAPTIDAGIVSGIRIVSGSEYLVFQDLRVTSSALGGQKGRGVEIAYIKVGSIPNHITLRRVTVEDTQQLVLYHDDHVVEDCTIKNNYSMGIHQKGNNFTVRGTTFINNGRPGNTFQHNLYVAAGDGLLFENNTIVGGPSGVKVRARSNATLRDNEFRSNESTAITLGPQPETPTSNIVIERNWIRDNAGGISIHCQTGNCAANAALTNVVIRNNIISDPTGSTAGVMVGQIHVSDSTDLDTLTNLRIYNNAIYGVTGVRRVLFLGPRSGGTASAWVIKNNILHRSDTGKAIIETRPETIANVEIDNNLYYAGDSGVEVLYDGSTGFATLSEVRAAYPGLESQGEVGDPHFANESDRDLRLTASSGLAIDRGAEIDAGGTDFAGNQRPAGSSWDIGPYEFGSEPGRQPPAAPILLP